MATSTNTKLSIPGCH